MSISYYDLLDVAPDASQEEIRAAWREAVADLDPTARRFAVYNEAAGVLLDPERRAAYDAERATGAEEETAAAVATEATSTTAAPDPAQQPAPAAAGDSAAGAAATDASGTPDPGRLRRGAARLGAVPTWALAVLGVVLVALVAGSIYLAAAVPSDDDIDAATRDAQSAAEQAIVPVLSYDHRSLEADGEAAREWMTDDYQEKYDQLFAQIEETAPETETVVRTEVVASGLIRALDRGGEARVQVLVFVDRPTRNKALDQPVVYKDQVRVTMEKVGDRWLVDQLCTTASCES